MKKHTIAIITAIIVALMIISLFFFTPLFLAEEDEAGANQIRQEQQ